jgi:hypothetical protein
MRQGRLIYTQKKVCSTTTSFLLRLLQQLRTSNLNTKVCACQEQPLGCFPIWSRWPVVSGFWRVPHHHE